MESKDKAHGEKRLGERKANKKGRQGKGMEVEKQKEGRRKDVWGKNYFMTNSEILNAYLALHFISNTECLLHA